MTQTIELPRLRTFDLLSPAEQAAIRRHCQNVVAVALRRRYGTEPSEEQVYIPEPAERKFTPAQQATFYNQLNTRRQREDAAKPGPQATPKPSRKGERKRGPKPMMGSGARR